MNSIHKSRGGDIAITHANPIKGDGLLIAIDHHKQDLASVRVAENIPSEMRETEIASLVSHVIGALPMSAEIPKQAAAFPSSTILHKPRANLLIAVPDLGRVTLAELDLSHLQEMRQNYPTYSVTSTFEPRNPVSQLTTMTTGDVPSNHGIVGANWIGVHGKSVSAFDDASSHALLPTVADVVSHTFPNSLIVSLSAQPNLAAAAGTHFPRSNTRILSVSAQGRSFTKSSGASSPVDMDAIAALISNIGPNSVLYQFSQDGAVMSVSSDLKVTVKPFAAASSVDDVVFDLSNTADFNFFAELVTAQNLLSDLRQNLKSLVEDTHPDLYTMTLTGFHGLLEAYESSDRRAQMAAQILDAAIPQIHKQLEVIYQGDLVAEVVLMGSSLTVHSQVKKAISDTLGGKLSKEIDFDSTYPSLYVEEAIPHDEVKALCSRVQKSLSGFDLKAECIAEFTRPVLFQQKMALKDDSSSSDDETTVDDIIYYQINLWVSVLLILILFGALYPLLYMNVTEGTYSSYLFAKKYV